MKEKKDKIIGWIENIFLGNMTIIILFIITGIIISKIFNAISTEYTYTAIGTILAFWYGYKRYERDKELENIYKGFFAPTKEININTLVANWTRAYNLYSRGIINYNYWKFLENEYLSIFVQELNSKPTQAVKNHLSKLLIYGFKEKKYFLGYVKNYLLKLYSTEEGWKSIDTKRNDIILETLKKMDIKGEEIVY